MKMVSHNVHCVHMDLVSSPIRDRELNINNKHDIPFDQLLLYFPDIWIKTSTWEMWLAGYYIMCCTTKNVWCAEQAK